MRKLKTTKKYFWRTSNVQNFKTILNFISQIKGPQKLDMGQYILFKNCNCFIFCPITLENTESML